MHVRRTSPLGVLLLAVLLAGCGSTVAGRTAVGVAGTTGDGLTGRGPTATGPTANPAGSGVIPPGTGGTAPPAATRPGAAAPALVPGAGATVTAGTVARPPVTIGVVLTATSNAASFGVSLGGNYGEQQIDQAIVDGINAQGGLAGRKVVPVYAKTDTGSSNWETDFAAACATFTQDHHVAAVLGYVFNYFSSFESCLARQGIPHLNTGFNIPDRKELAPFPDFLAVDTPTIDRRGLLKLDGAAADGVLTRTSRIGVLTDTCPGTQSSLTGTFLPEVRRLGLTVTKSIAITCTNGNADTGGAVQAIQSAELQFASSGVDHVIFHSVSEGPPLLLFTLDANSQGYHPTYVVSSLANLDALKGYFPKSQISHIHGYGWMANQDVPPSAYPHPNASQRRCLGLLKAKGITPTVGTDFAYAYNFCEAVFLYGAALERTGGNSNGTAVMAAIHGLGSDRESVINNEGSAFGSRLLDAVRADRHVVYQSGCSCFGYTGPVRLVPPA